MVPWIRRTQEKDTLRFEGVVEKRQQLVLQFRLEIDEQIAAADQIELGEGRVLDQVLRREDHHLADVFLDPVTESSR